MIKIKTLHFDDYEEFACVIADKYNEVKNNDDLCSVDIVAKYYDAKEIIRELVGIGYDIVFMNKFGVPEWDDYDDEFTIGVYDDGIWVEPVKRDTGYISIESGVVYILDDCNSKIISYIESNKTYAVEIGDCDYSCENCDLYEADLHDGEINLHTSKGVDGNTHGFTASKSDDDSYMSYSFYSSSKMNYEDIQKMLKFFGF